MSNLSTSPKKLPGRPVDPNSKKVIASNVYAQLAVQGKTREEILNAIVEQAKVKLSTATVYYSNIVNPPDPNRTKTTRRSRKASAAVATPAVVADSVSVDNTNDDGGDSSGVNITDGTVPSGEDNLN